LHQNIDDKTYQWPVAVTSGLKKELVCEAPAFTRVEAGLNLLLECLLLDRVYGLPLKV
jgi:hypothetical protein